MFGSRRVRNDRSRFAARSGRARCGSTGVGRLDMIIVELSCCAPYELVREPRCRSTRRRSPPSAGCSASTTCDRRRTTRWRRRRSTESSCCRSSGLIQMSWLSPCGVRIDAIVLPPSVDLKKSSAPAYTTSALVGIGAERGVVERALHEPRRAVHQRPVGAGVVRPVQTRRPAALRPARRCAADWRPSPRGCPCR